MKPFVYDKRTVKRVGGRGTQQGGCPDCLLEFQTFLRRRPRVQERAVRVPPVQELHGALEAGPRPAGLSIEEQRRIFERERSAILSERGELTSADSARPALLGLSFFGDVEGADDAINGGLVEEQGLESSFNFDFDSEIPLGDEYGSVVTQSRLSRLWGAEREGDVSKRSVESTGPGATPGGASDVSGKGSPRKLDLGALFTLAARIEADPEAPSFTTGTSGEEGGADKSVGWENLRRIDVMDLLGFSSADNPRSCPKAEVNRSDVDGVGFTFHEHKQPSTNLLYGSGRGSSGTDLSAAARQSLMRAMKLDQRTTIK